MNHFTLAGILHLVLGLLLTLDILLHKHRPVSAVMWLGLVWVLPVMGPLLYLTFGVDRVSRGAEARRVSSQLVAQRALLQPTLERLGGRTSFQEEWELPTTLAQRVMRATDHAAPFTAVLPGNRAELLVDGDQFYPQLAAAIDAATDSVHLQTFIFGRDEVGRALLDRLMAAVRRGVTVRLLYDRFGSAYARVFRLFEPAKKAGVKVFAISQANPLKGRFQVNLRNHRKVTVIDGKVGFVGGINIARENLSTAADGAPIRDYHVRLEGPAVADLQLQFLQDWYFASGEHLEDLVRPELFPEVPKDGLALVKIVPGGPDRRPNGLDEAFFGAIVAAEESVTVVTPYFVPDEPIVQALRNAALRGIAVTVVVPRDNNHWYAGYAARSLYGPLLRAGARVFERRPPFMHAKALLVDDVFGMLGSANLDYRSLHLNFETNIAVVEPGFVYHLRRQIETELGHSDQVDPTTYHARPITRRLAENFCFLFEPLL